MLNENQPVDELI